MHGILGNAETKARKANVTSDAVATDLSDDEKWFAEAAKILLECKAGTALHYATGFDERSCQRYASGQVKPPAYFLRSLLRGPDGWIWLSALMEDCDADWWRNVRLAVAYEQKRSEVDARSII